MLLVVPFAALHVALAFASAYWLVLALIPALLFTRRLLPAARNGWVDLAREACLALSAYLVYFLVRGMVKDQAGLAYTHAEHVIAFERRLGIFWELGLHRRVVNSAALVSVANWIYVWFYWPVLVAALVWLFRWHRATYPLYRNALLVSGSLGLVLFATFQWLRRASLRDSTSPTRSRCVRSPTMCSYHKGSPTNMPPCLACMPVGSYWSVSPLPAIPARVSGVASASRCRCSCF